MPHRRPGSLLLAATIAAAVAAPAAHAQGPPPCAPVVVGTWKPETTAEANPIFLAFSTDGWVSLLDSSGGGARAADFDIMAQASYTLDLRARTPRIHFRTARGSDLLPPGESSWTIAAHDDASLTIPNPETGHATKWVRVQTHRYFITFAAGGPEVAEGGSAFAMWTRLDGRSTELEAMGLYAATTGEGRAAAVFGRVPAALAERFATEGDHEEDAIIRLELDEAEFYRTRAVFEKWDKRLRSRTLGPGDAYTRALEILLEAAGSLNACGVRITPVAAPAAGEVDRRQEPSELVRRLRQANRKRHVDDGTFPFVWEPPPPR